MMIWVICSSQRDVDLNLRPLLPKDRVHAMWLRQFTVALQNFVEVRTGVIAPCVTHDSVENVPLAFRYVVSVRVAKGSHLLLQAPLRMELESRESRSINNALIPFARECLPRSLRPRPIMSRA